MRAVCEPWARRKHSTANSWAPYKDAVGMSFERSRDAVYTLLLAIFVFRGDPQRADRLSERCTDAAASSFGVTGALG